MKRKRCGRRHVANGRVKLTNKQDLNGTNMSKRTQPPNLSDTRVDQTRSGYTTLFVFFLNARSSYLLTFTWVYLGLITRIIRIGKISSSAIIYIIETEISSFWRNFNRGLKYIFVAHSNCYVILSQNLCESQIFGNCRNSKLPSEADTGILWHDFNIFEGTSYINHISQPSSCCDLFATSFSSSHDDVIKWKHFPRYWPFVRGTHRSPVNSPHKGQWRRAMMFSFICA